MPCPSCERRTKEMKAAVAKRLEREAARARNIWAKVTGHANPPANVQAPEAKRAGAPVEATTDAGRSTIDTGTEHRKQRLAAVKATGTGEGRVSVPKVRKVGHGKGSPRRPQG